VFQGAGVAISLVALFFTWRSARRQRQRDRRDHVDKVFVWSRRLEAEKQENEAFEYEISNASAYPLKEARIGHRVRWRRRFFYVRNVSGALLPSREIGPGDRVVAQSVSTLVGYERIRSSAFIQDAWGNWWRRTADKPAQWSRASARRVPVVLASEQALPRRLRKLRASWAETARLAALKKVEEDLAWRKMRPGSIWYEAPKSNDDSKE